MGKRHDRPSSPHPVFVVLSVPDGTTHIQLVWPEEPELTTAGIRRLIKETPEGYTVEGIYRGRPIGLPAPKISGAEFSRRVRAKTQKPEVLQPLDILAAQRYNAGASLTEIARSPEFLRGGEPVSRQRIHQRLKRAERFGIPITWRTTDT